MNMQESHLFIALNEVVFNNMFNQMFIAKWDTAFEAIPLSVVRL